MIIIKTELTTKMEKAIRKETAKNMGLFQCYEVTIGWYGNGRVDFMTMDTKDIFRCYELKITKEDFHSKHGHNFVGHFNYYVIPEELYDDIKDEIPKHIGVYCYYEDKDYCSLIKKPKKHVVTDDMINILKNSMIRSLYREANKYIKNTKMKYNKKHYKNFNEVFEYNMVTHSRDFSHELVTYQLFNY